MCRRRGASLCRRRDSGRHTLLGRPLLCRRFWMGRKEKHMQSSTRLRCECTMPLRPPPVQERLPPVLEAKLTAWWKENHRGLLLPPMYPAHRHVWTEIDMGCTVCRVCGIAHVCGSAQNLVKCNEIVQVNPGVGFYISCGVNLAQKDTLNMPYPSRGRRLVKRDAKNLRVRAHMCPFSAKCYCQLD